MKIKNVTQLELIGVAVETEAGLAVVRAEEEGTKNFVPTNPATCESKESCLRDASQTGSAKRIRKTNRTNPMNEFPIMPDGERLLRIQEVAALLRMSDKTVRRYEIPNPLKRVENLDVPVRYPQGPRAFSEEELEKLFAIANPYRRLIYRFLAFTGLRRIEAQRLQWGDLHLDDTTPGLFLRPEATKARRADWLPILPALVPELEAARPAFWKPDTLVFRRGVTAPDTLRKDMTTAGIPLVDKLGRPVGIHTFRRTFISHLQKRGVHSRVIMQLARHKSLSLTDWTYTDTTKLPLADGIASLTKMAGSASPLSSPLKSGQTGVLAVKVVQTEKTEFENRVPENVEAEKDCLALAGSVQTDENHDLVPGVGVEPFRFEKLIR